jgi:hypothetical protein
MPNRAFVAGAFLLMVSGISQAGVIYDGGSGTTVYGATGYTCTPCAVGPQYILNNLTGNIDILTSPGSGYQVANPVIGNNIAETPNGGLSPGGVSNATPYVFSAAGGNAPLSGAPFGSGTTVNSGPAVAFAMTDATAGCCTASYMITSWDADYTVDAAGLNAFNAYLGIVGTNLTTNDAAVASLIVNYSVNGGAYQALTDMIVAEAGNCNNVLAGDVTGGVNAACGNGGNGGAFAAAAVDTANGLGLVVGDTLDFESTLTVYADPANFDSIDSQLDSLLLPGLDLTAPNILIGDDATTPEPGTLVLLGAGLASICLLRRRKAS